MRKLEDIEKEELWREVREEFRDDEMMQQIHYVRLLHYRQTKGLSSRERVRFYGYSAQKTSASNVE